MAKIEDPKTPRNAIYQNPLQHRLKKKLFFSFESIDELSPCVCWMLLHEGISIKKDETDTYVNGTVLFLLAMSSVNTGDIHTARPGVLYP